MYFVASYLWERKSLMADVMAPGTTRVVGESHLRRKMMVANAP